MECMVAVVGTSILRGEHARFVRRRAGWARGAAFGERNAKAHSLWRAEARLLPHEMQAPEPHPNRRSYILPRRSRESHGKGVTSATFTQIARRCLASSSPSSRSCRPRPRSRRSARARWPPPSRRASPSSPRCSSANAKRNRRRRFSRRKGAHGSRRGRKHYGPLPRVRASERAFLLTSS